jgi:signal transduction histidine kinase/CheY-like chemotaxis protein
MQTATSLNNIRRNAQMSGNGPDFPLYSISEIAKRTFNLAVTAFIIGCIIFIYYIFLGYYKSALIVSLTCGGISTILLLNHKKIIKNTKFPLILFVSLSLLVFALNEGAGTGQYLYFFPLIIAIPIIVDNQKTYFKKVIIYFSISVASFIACIIIGRTHTPWQTFTDANLNLVFYTNAVSAAFASICFAYVNIFLERKYLQVLLDQKNNTISSRTKFLSTMGHELRTPLNGIVGAVNLLKKERSLVEQQEYFDILQYCSNHMLHQVNDILDFNKIEAGKLNIHPVQVNLKQLIVNSTIPFANLFEEKNLTLKLAVDDALDVIVLADDVRIIQVLNNLLSNAGKFTNSGFVKLTVNVLSKSKDGIYIKCIVEDTGIGIDEKDLEQVFDTFGQVFDESTRKFSGSGLGLTICNGILNLMNSQLELKSTKGVGSTFSFGLKLGYPVSVESVKLNQPFTDTDLSGLKILLVEDNAINMIIGKKMLLDYKATCIPAVNGQEALDLLKDGAVFNLILLDLEMPILNGFDTVKRIKQSWPHLPVLAFTATLMDIDMLNGLKTIGFSDYISKPFQPPYLISQIQKYALPTQVDIL